MRFFYGSVAGPQHGYSDTTVTYTVNIPDDDRIETVETYVSFRVSRLRFTTAKNVSSEWFGAPSNEIYKVITGNGAWLAFIAGLDGTWIDSLYFYFVGCP